MATREINLVSEKEALSSQDIRIRRLLKFWTPLFLVIFLIILGVAVFFQFRTTQQLSGLNTQISSVENQIKSMERNESAYLLLKQKATAISDILNSRFAFIDIINYFKSFENNDVKINSMSLMNSGTIQLDMRLGDSELLDNLLTTFIEAGGKKFKTIELTSINLRPDYTYEINLNIDTLKNREATSSLET